MATDYSPITELPGNQAHWEQLEILHTRYDLARQHATGRDVLEVGCGPGRGLGYLAASARRVVGGDFTEALVRMARDHYGGHIPVLRLDAQTLPFSDASFDVVVLFETLYYIPQAAAFVREAYRVLRPGGVLLISSSNRQVRGFIASPLSVRYYAAGELDALLSGSGFSVELRAGFPVGRRSPVGLAITALRQIASRLSLVPGSMRGKAWLKRVFYGRLTTLGPEIETEAPIRDLTEVGTGPVTDHLLLYAIARKET